MTAAQKHYTYVSDIKGNALNKGRARTWIEKNLIDLAEFGFTADCRVDIEFRDHSIVVTANTDGKRKPTVRKGKLILDICYPLEQRDSMFKGSPRLQVWITRGQIVITAPNIAAP